MSILGIDASRAVKKEKTGVEWYSWHLLHAMQKLTPSDWRVRLYIPNESGIWNLSADRQDNELGSWSWRVLKWIGPGWTQGRLSLEMMKSPPDVLFVPSHTIPLVHPEHTVTTVHDAVFLKHPELYAPDDLENQKRGLDFALKFAKRIIVPTRAVQDDLLRVGAKESQVAVVPHGVELGEAEKSEIRNPKSEIIPKFQIPNSKFVLFVGRIERKKNVMNLIHAFRRLIDTSSPGLRPPSPSGRGEGEGDLKLVLAGSLGFGGDDVLQAIKTFKLEDRVVHLGYIDRVQYLELLHHASLLILPSLGEGFGMPVIEAMSAGVPVVCSDILALLEVGGNAAQYVNPHSSKDIARGIATILENDMLQSEMIHRGKERVQEFTWERTAEQTWQVITSL